MSTTKCVCAVTPTKKGGVRRMQVGGERAAAESFGLRVPVVGLALAVRVGV